jgi:serine/threonine protein kinase
VEAYLIESQAQASSYKKSGRSFPRPAFGSSPNLQALVLESDDRSEGGDSRSEALTNFYEVTIASVDQPRLLSRVSEALGDLNLNICEAHAFNTLDKFSLDVFVVNGWTGKGVDDLEEVLSERLQQMPPPVPPADSLAEPDMGLAYGDRALLSQKSWGPGGSDAGGGGAATVAATPPDDWELDPADLFFQGKIASGAFGDLYKGVYCGQEVAVKILRNVHENTQQYEEFLQEVSIMRKVRHKNIVQFIGACTRKPNLFIVFEYMSGGSVYDYLRQVGGLKMSTILKVATEVCRGMDYLHKRKILHRDLKAANLLMDEGGVVKIADFGVARVMDTQGVMTAETGTYRWMAPEVIEHNPYNNKADVFSFGIVLWELLTGKVPYADMTPLQAAVGVVQKGLRPPIPSTCPAPLAAVIQECWERDPEARPAFDVLKVRLEELWCAQRDEEVRRVQSGFLSKLRKHKA